ncbi:hypothetical protein MHH28_05205 [Paenibacillus sp. FSL K6-1217]|uniref:hypothetical protein n=1 Tax=Paenibacillus sp. FSL K6-1217 TaxID=2921466 RepID=UPI003253A6A2
MILLNPATILIGDYRFEARNNAGPEVVVYDKEGRVYRLDADFTPRDAGQLYNLQPLNLDSLSFHPEREMAAFIMQDAAIGAGDFTGGLLWSKAGAYVCVLFSRDGGLIWSVDKLDEEHLRISVFHSGDGTLAHSLDLEDPFGDSMLRLSDIPESDAVTLELAAGQNGISVFELSIQEDGLRSREMFPQGCYLAPAWHPDGKQLFTLENDMQVYARFSYPALELLQEQGPHDGDYEDEVEEEDSYPGYGMLYLQNGQTITQNSNERFFLFDPAKMERIDEWAFAGYEPVPASVVFPSLDDDPSQYSQIQSCERAGSLLMFRTGSLHDIPHLLMVEEAALTEAIRSVLTKPRG